MSGDAGQEGAATLASTAGKLVHQLSEVRRRAVQSLDFKIRHGLTSIQELTQDRLILKSLLGCLDYPDNGTQTDAAVLMLLAKVVPAPFVAKQLLHLGAEARLSSLKHSKAPELAGLVDNVLSALLAAPALAGVASTPGQASFPTSSSVRALPYGSATSSAGAQAAPWPGGGGALPYTGPGGMVTLPLPAPPHASSRQQHHEHDRDDGVGGQGSRPAAYGPADELRARGGGAIPAVPVFTWSPSRHRPAASPPRTAQQASTSAARTSVARPLAPSHPVTVEAMSGSARAALAHKRADRQRQATLLDPGASFQGEASPSDWVLAPVALGQMDDQELFELSLRLKYMDDPRVVLPALLELHSATLLDVPIEAVAVRHDVLNHLLVLLTSASARRDMVELAVRCLLRITVLLKKAMVLNTDAMYVGSAAQPEADGSAGAAKGASAQHLDGGEQRGVQAGASALADDAAGAYGGSASAAPQQRCLPYGLPPPPDPSRHGAAAHAAAAGLVNVSKLVYLIALQAFEAMKNPQRHYMLAPLVEELVPLLLLGRNGPLLAAGQSDVVKWSTLLQVLSQALVANLSIARAESPQIVQAYMQDGSGPLPPLVNSAVASILVLATRLLSSLPRDLWTPEVVPAAIVDSLAAVARDDVLCLMLGGLRPAAAPLLACLRPDVQRLLDVAADGERALEAGDVLVRQLPLLQAGSLASKQWLGQLSLALPALHLPGQDRLLQVAIQGLAAACTAPAPEATASAAATGASAAQGWEAQAEGVFLTLLNHPQPAVMLSCYGLLESMLADSKGRDVAAQQLSALLSRQAIVEHLVVMGLGNERTRRQVARILTALLGDAGCHAAILEWSCWIRLYEDDPQVGALASSLAIGLRNSMQGLSDKSWDKQGALVQELFCRQAERRRDAARQLADALYFSGTPVPTLEPHSADPFKVVLDGGARDDLVLPNASARLARGFRAADVDSLMAILANPSLAQELRRSAAEQLTSLAAEPKLLDLLACEACLSTIAGVATLRDASSGVSSSQAGALQAQGLDPPSLDLLSSLDMQLPVAALNLLYTLAARSAAARAWLTGQGIQMLLAAVPMVFHNLATVRRAAARFFAAVCFGTEADRWEDWAPASSQAAGVRQASGAGGGTTVSCTLQLPQAFDRVYVLPCRVAWVTTPAGQSAEAMADALTADRPKLQDLLAEQRELVVLLVSERQAVKAVGGDPVRLLHKMEQDPEALNFAPAVLHSLAANIRALSPEQQVAAGLTAVRGAASHAQCEEALYGLQATCATWQGVSAFAGSEWQVPLERLLVTSPTSAEDRALWLQLLSMLQRAMASGSMSQAQYLHLALCFQQSVPYLLSAPAAAVDPPGLPVALASSPAVPDHSAQYALLGFTQAVLTALVELVRSARLHLPASQAMRVVSSLSLPSTLQLLADAFVAKPGANYGCRAAAVQLLLEVLQVLKGAQAAGEQAVLMAEGLDEPLVACLSGLLAHVCAGRSGSNGAGGAKDRQGSFCGKAMLRLAMHCLLDLMCVLPTARWVEVWQQVSGTFWLSRLTRDRDAPLRALAAELLARLMQPAAGGAHAMVLQGWPDAHKMMMQAVLDRGNCYAVQSAALRVVSCCLAQQQLAIPDNTPQAHSGPSDAEDGGSEWLDVSAGAADGSAAQGAAAASAASTPAPRRQLFSSGALPPAVLLLSGSASDFWEQLPALLLDSEAPAPFVSAALGVVLQGLLLQPQRFAALLRTPGVLGRLLQVLQPQPLAEVSVREERKAVAGLLQTLPAAPGWADTTAEVLERSVGLDGEVRAEAGPSPSAAEALRLAPVLHQTAGVAAQLLTVAQQDPPLLQLHLLGHSSASVTSAMLRTLVRLAGDVATLDSASQLYTGPSAAAHAAQLQALGHVVSASTALLQQLSVDEAREVLVGVNEASWKAAGPLAALCCEVLLAGCAGRSLKVATVCLLATMLSERATALRLLHFEGSGDEFIVASTGKDVGSSLCAALTSMLPDDAFMLLPASCGPAATPSWLLQQPSPPGSPAAGPPLSRARRPAGGEGSSSGASGRPVAWQNASSSSGAGIGGRGVAAAAALSGASAAADVALAGVSMLGPDDLVTVVALRNLLTHSGSAKIAALSARMHGAMVQCCTAVAGTMAALQAAADKRSSAGGTPVKGTGARGARSSAAASAAGTAAPTPSVQGASRTSKWSLRGDPAGQPSRVGAAGPATSARLQPPAQATSPVRGPAGQRQPQPHLQAARHAIEQKAVVSLSLLKHLAYKSPAAKSLLVRDGLVAALRAVWPYAAAATASPLFHELLGCITNCLPDCPDARARFATEGDASDGPSVAPLLDSLLGAMFTGPRLEQSTFRLAVGVLQHLTAAEDGAQLLVKSTFLPACHKALQDMSNSGGAGGRAGPKPPMGKDLQRQTLLLQVLANLAAFPAGMHALLRSAIAPGLLGMVVRLVAPGEDDNLAQPAPQLPPTQAAPALHQQQTALRVAALGLLRNLCFAPDAKSHLLAHPAVLPALVGAAEAVASSPQGAAYAASGLWAMIYHGEKVKSALRRVPSAVERLVASLAACQFQASRAAALAQAQRLRSKPGANATAAPAGGGAATAGDASLPEAGLEGHGGATHAGGQLQEERCKWLQLAEGQLMGVLEAMQSTTTGGAGPDRSPARDQTGWSRPHAQTRF